LIEESIVGKREVIFLDLDRVVELLKQHGLLRYLLFADPDNE
jgi:hypothetical protein